MTDLEDRLRNLLSQHAVKAPSGAAMLAAVRRESTRRRRRRTVLASAATAVVVAAVTAVAAPLGIWGPSPVTGPAAPEASAHRVALVPGRPITVSFPFTPPEQYRQAGDVSVTVAAGRPTLRHGAAGISEHPITVAVATVAPGEAPITDPARAPETDRAWSDPPTGETTPGPERSGKVRLVSLRHTKGVVIDPPPGVTEGAERVLRWLETEQQLVEVRVSTDVTDDELLRYAGALTARPMSAGAAYGFALAPEGFTIDNVNPFAVTFCPPEVAHSEDFIGKITVMLSSVPVEPLDGRKVRVGSHDGWLAASTDSTTLSVQLDSSRVLVVQVPTPAPLSDIDLIRFAAGISVTPAAELSHG